MIKKRQYIGLFFFAAGLVLIIGGYLGIKFSPPNNTVLLGLIVGVFSMRFFNDQNTQKEEII